MRALPATELLDRWEAGLAQPRWEWARAIVAAADPALTADSLDAMTVGERDRRLLDLRESIFGSQLACRSRCPMCGESVEMTVDIAMLRVDVTRSLETTVDVPEYSLRVRIPNLKDLGHAARAPDVQAMRDVLLDRCVTGGSAGIAEVPAAALQRIVDTMAAADPQANVQLDLKCPVCAQTWSEVFDILEFFWSELDGWAERLLQDIHVLATAYGWSEAEVLALSPTRRARYLNLVGS